MDQQALQILTNTSVPWDATKAAYLDQVAAWTLGSDPTKINAGNSILQSLNDDPSFWMNVDKVMAFCQNPRAKFYSLVILQSAIKVKWKALSPEQKEGIRNFTGHLIMTLSEQDNLDRDTEDILKKSNGCLVQILKYEWNTTWTDFIAQICQSSQKNMNVCQNNFLILKLLSEEIFDFSKNEMTAQQISELKQTMNSQFTNIFNLCELVLNNYDKLKPQLIKTCLDTLQSFLSWIPVIFIYFSDIMKRITSFLANDHLRQSALNCLIQIANIPVDLNMERVDEIKQKLFITCSETLTIIGNILTMNEDITTVRNTRFRNTLPNFDVFCKQVALFLSNMIREQAAWLLQIENQSVINVIRHSFKILVYLLNHPDEQTFKIIIDFFHHFMKNTLGLGQVGTFGVQSKIPHMYIEYFSQLRNVVCIKMAKPQQVLIVIDQTGTPVKQDLANTENNSFYDTMIEILVYLVRIDWPTMRNFLTHKIETQMDQKQFKYEIINSLSWAVGALAGNLPPGEDKPFLISVLKILLHLCEHKKGKATKAVIASCIMFVVGQYPDFLRNNWNFLKTVLKKLFEFMKERYEGVMEMACNTFLKICKLTQAQLLAQHEGDKQPYICGLIRSIPDAAFHLDDTNKIMLLIEGVAHLVAVQPSMNLKITYMKQILGSSLKQFITIVQSCSQDSSILQDQSTEANISNFLKINEILAGVVGAAYGPLLAEFNKALNEIYIYYGTVLNDQVNTNGAVVINYFVNKRMRNINKQILRLYKTYVSACGDLSQGDMEYIKQTFILSLSQVLEIFTNSIPELKQPEFISLFTVVFERLHEVLTSQFISPVMETIFGAALGMITNDFSSYPEIRQSFFQFLKAMIKYNFERFYSMPGDKFQTSFNCVVWSFKHHLSTFSDLGLDLMEQILNSMNSNFEIAQAFYPKFYINLLKDLLEVLTDGYHKSGMKQQCKLIFILIQVVSKNYLNVKLSLEQTGTNAEYVYNFLLTILNETFSNVGKSQTSAILISLFSTDDQKQFRTILRDYLVLINRLSSGQNVQIKQFQTN